MGEVAATSGLTVRTLHHWDEIGILSPQNRGAGGRREYTESDLGRLYVVLTLRQLGLSLESIRACLDAGLDPRRVLTDQLDHLDHAIADLSRLRERVATIVEAGGELTGKVDPAGMLTLMRGARAGAGEVLDRHVSKDHRAQLASGAATVGPALAYVLEIEWPELYRRVEELRVAGARPDDPQVQKSVARMDQLSTWLNAGGEEAGAAVRSAWRDDPASMSGEPEQVAAPWRYLAQFVDEARALLRGEC
ncbi:MerR family transcriptional regulator [Nocardioides daejeonensis]|uniref:MerR family transcriptional regulator n=1 Tax=Nocardioides daejeonensis TaxID=1046556 RepID=UPI00195270B7|nr:MerR family transcriptional regulator [Nocardioides daejeonensis]